MTWRPQPNMTPAQIKKALERERYNFEDKVKSGKADINNQLTLTEFIDIWKQRYGVVQLKKKTYGRYCEIFDRVNLVLGHIPLSKLQPHHLLDFYANLAEDGIRKNARYTVTSSFSQFLKSKKITREELAKKAGISITTLRGAINGNPIKTQTMVAICTTLKIDSKKHFIKVSTDAPLGPASIAYHDSVIRSLLSKAKRWGYIADNPADHVDPPKYDYAEASCPDAAECKKIIDLLQNEDINLRTIVILILETGMRKGEALGLQWADVDFDKSIVKITKERIYIRGVGSITDTPKNKSSIRIIKIPSKAIQILQTYRDAQLVECKKCGRTLTDDMFIFTNKRGEPIHPDTPSKKFRAFADKNGLSSDIHLHSLRHANASIMIANHVDIKTVSHRLGHADVQTTGKIYTHAIATADAAAADMLDSVF